MRKGIADLHRRAEVSQKSNDRLIHAMAAADDSRSVEELTGEVQKPAKWRDTRVRGLHPWGGDKGLLEAVNHGNFFLNGMRNRDLQALLFGDGEVEPDQRRPRSAAMSRRLRILRAHGIIQKVQRTHRYHVTIAGRTILVAVMTTARVTVNQLSAPPCPDHPAPEPCIGPAWAHRV